MVNNPGRPMTIYDIPSVVSIAYPLAATPTNIHSGFVVAGIAPFNRDIFTESDYAAGYVTDRPQPLSLEIAENDVQTRASDNLVSTASFTIPETEAGPSNRDRIAPTSGTITFPTGTL